MENPEITVNSEVVEKAVEEAASVAVEKLANVNSGNAAKIAVGFGVGVLAGVVVCKVIVPKIGRKLKGFRTKYVTYVPTEDGEEPTETEENNEPPAEEQKEEETSEKSSKKKK